MVCRWPIEIDDLPIKSGGSFHGYVSHNQMVNPWCVWFNPYFSPYQRWTPKISSSRNQTWQWIPRKACKKQHICRKISHKSNIYIYIYIYTIIYISYITITNSIYIYTLTISNYHYVYTIQIYKWRSIALISGSCHSVALGVTKKQRGRGRLDTGRTCGRWPQPENLSPRKW